MREVAEKREELVINYFEFVKSEIEKMKNSESGLTPSELARYVEICNLFRS